MDNANKDRAADIIKQQAELAGARGNWETHWQEIADLMSPMRSDFNVLRTPGEKRQQKIFDGTPLLALDQLASGLWGMVSNSANDWFTLKVQGEDYSNDHDMVEWLEYATGRMRDVFSANGLVFYSRVLDLYSDLGSFGTGVFFVEELPGRGIQFMNFHLNSTFIAENDIGKIDKVIRKFKFTARQAIRRWGDKCSEAIKKAADDSPQKEFTFLHSVMPSDEVEYDRLDYRAWPWRSCYVSVDDNSIIEEGGYQEFPYMVPRWSTRSRGVYGDSPAMLALPDVKMLNVMEQTNVKGLQKVVDPPLLADNEKTMRGMRTTPGAIIYGGVDEQGRPKIVPLQTNARPDLGFEALDQKRNAIREAFYYSLMMMVQQPNQTATEILARQEEKLRLMGPALGRIQSEFLDPLIDRVWEIMLRAKQFGPPETFPQALQSTGIKVEYVSPLAKAQKASEGASIMRTMDALMPLAQFNPGIMDNIDGDAVARKIADAYGMPASLLRSSEDVAAKRDQDAQRQAMMSAMSAAKPLASAAKDAAQANQITDQQQQQAA